MSQQLARLQNQLASATGVDQKAELGARIACDLARYGRFEAAQARIDDLRRAHGGSNSGRVTVWIMLAEGLLHAHHDEPAPARDRLSRAQLLGLALHDDAFVAVVSAWKAVLEFEAALYDDTVASLRSAVAHAQGEADDVRARVSTLLCGIHTAAGQPALAQRWATQAHRLAVSLGDQLGIEALQSQRAVLGLATLRVAACFGSVEAESLRRARLELQTAQNLNRLTQSQAPAGDLALPAARLSMLEGRHADALAALDAVRAQPRWRQRPADLQLIELESTWCRWMLGGSPGTPAFAAALPATDWSLLRGEDAIAAAWLQQQLATADAAYGSAAAHAAHAAALRAERAHALSRLAEDASAAAAAWLPAGPGTARLA